jgi:cytidine deaminase
VLGGQVDRSGEGGGEVIDKVIAKAKMGENMSVGELVELVNTIESLRCCGTCSHYLQGFCLRDDTMVSRRDNCRDWEMMELI